MVKVLLTVADNLVRLLMVDVSLFSERIKNGSGFH